MWCYSRLQAPLSLLTVLTSRQNQPIEKFKIPYLKAVGLTICGPVSDGMSPQKYSEDSLNTSRTVPLQSWRAQFKGFLFQLGIGPSELNRNSQKKRRTRHEHENMLLFQEVGVTETRAVLRWGDVGLNHPTAKTSFLEPPHLLYIQSILYCPGPPPIWDNKDSPQMETCCPWMTQKSMLFHLFFYGL
ncbi:hypothetical protein GN956_G9802 [Arapaima gigas]